MVRNESRMFRAALFRVAAGVLLGLLVPAVADRSPYHGTLQYTIDAFQPSSASAPAPLLKKGQPVNWWFVFKFNAASFPACGAAVQRTCTFGGTVQTYKSPFGQQFSYASSDQHSLQQGSGCVGETVTDPVGATFDQVYNGSLFYVVWNDQFYDDPVIQGCTKECGGPWGHSKGVLAWNAAGDGFVLQVSTPSWPGAGSKNSPRKKDGNTLGCVLDNDVEVSQHFFSLKLTKDDLLKVLRALANASVVTDVANSQLVNNGGPADVQALVRNLGKKSDSRKLSNDTLSSGVELISKPSHLNVPPWQMVSAVLGGVSLRAATWWEPPKIPGTTTSTPVGCWDSTLDKPGAVEIATTGTWAGKTLGLEGGARPDGNHAKIGVSTSGTHEYSIFGDMNQQGSLSPPNCGSSQNGRGGLFYVVDDGPLFDTVTALLKGASAKPSTD
jgi:hypothetical protein